MCQNALPNPCTCLIAGIEVVILQVATTSRGSSARPLQRGGLAHVPNARTSSGNVAPQAPPTSTTRAEGSRSRKEGPGEILALREGEALPEGYDYVVRTRGNEGAAHGAKAALPRDTVDLTTPPEGGPSAGGETSTERSEGQPQRGMRQGTQTSR